jgi:D-alanyl-D-alanine carboxypeptidase/D-alanyl-D-alanine-endopeptidase (penicillin-binding protein 4)
VSLIAPPRPVPTRGSDQVTEEIHITRRALREPPIRFSRRTRRALLGLTVGTLVLGTALVVATVTAQGLRAEGRDDAAALTAALEAAQADAVALATALEDTSALAVDARALAEILTPRQEDVSAEAVEGVARAVDALGAAVRAPAPEPSLPDAIGTPSALPGRYVAADRADLDALRTRVAAEIDRLDALGRRSVEQVAELAELAAAVSDTAGAAAQAAVATAATTLTATPEAPADTRTRFEEAVAALTALGDAPDPGADTRQAFTTFFTAADTLRRAHGEAVLAREAAEREAAERAAAEREAAERAAAEREAERPWWWWGDDDWPPRRG